MDDNDITRRNVVEALGAAGVAIAGAAAGRYIAENQDKIDQEGAEANYIGKNTDMESIGIRSIDVDFYPQQRSGGNEASGLAKIGNKVLTNGVLGQSPLFADVGPAPVDGGGQYQGNAASTGYTQTTKDPVTSFGELNTVDTPNANSPAVSLNGRTAIAGSGSMDVYDQNGDKIASFENGTQSVPLLLDGGSKVVGSDSTGAYLHDIDNEEQIASAPSDIAANRGSIKLSNDRTIGIQSADNVVFLEPDDLDTISFNRFDTGGLRNFAIANSDNALSTGGLEKDSGDIANVVRSVNPRTGEVRWVSDDITGNRVTGNGAATNGDVYVMTDSGGRAHVLNVENGDKIKTLDIGQKPSVSSPVFDADSNLYTLTDRFTKFNSDYEQVWSTPANGLGNITVGADNVLMASTTNAVQMLDTESGEVVDEALSNGKAKSIGMPRNGKLPVIEFDTGNYYELPLERSQSDPAQSPLAYVDLSLQGPEDTVPVGETAQLSFNAAIEDDAPAPVRLTYELVVRHEGEQGILEDTTIGQPGETTTEDYPVTTESSEQDAVTTNGTAIDWDVKFEDDSTPGNETARANATATNSTFSN